MKLFESPEGATQLPIIITVIIMLLLSLSLFQLTYGLEKLFQSSEGTKELPVIITGTTIVSKNLFLNCKPTCNANGILFQRMSPLSI